MSRDTVEGFWSAMNAGETELMEAIGMKPCRVLTRWPLTIGVERRGYMPGLVAALLALEVSHRHGLGLALLAAGIAALAFSLSLVVHEAGHLLCGRRVDGVTPRVLVLRSTGGVSVVEGRYTDARGAALFASGGPLATLAITAVLIAGGMMLPVPLSTGLILPAVLNLLLLGLNLLPVAPMDGFMLFRSALWMSFGDRAEAERRAIEWSRCVLACGILVALIVLKASVLWGFMTLFVVATLFVQHHVVSSASERAEPARR